MLKAGTFLTLIILCSMIMSNEMILESISHTPLRGVGTSAVARRWYQRSPHFWPDSSIRLVFQLSIDEKQKKARESRWTPCRRLFVRKKDKVGVRNCHTSTSLTSHALRSVAPRRLCLLEKQYSTARRSVQGLDRSIDICFLTSSCLCVNARSTARS